jgi:RND family efflux transporter MFP subunit
MYKSITAILFTTSTALLLGGCNWDSRADTGTPYLHRAITLPVAIESSYVEQREFAGEVQAGQSSELGFEFSGRVAELYADVGDAVTRGQLLARLDVRLLDSERSGLNAQRAQISAELETVQRNLARIQRLQAESLASERELDELTGSERVLQASLQRVDAALEANAVRRDKSELRAPFAAVIAERRMDTGVVAAAGTPVFSLVQEVVREVHSGVPAAMTQSLSIGDIIEVRSGPATTDGTVVGLGPVVDPATRSRILRVSVEEDWAPGQLAYAVLGVPVEKPGAWLPDTAVTEGTRGTWVVYAAVEAGDSEAVLEARSVVIHHASGNAVYVSGALADGERVVIAGLHRLAPGQRVRAEQNEHFADAR